MTSGIYKITNLVNGKFYLGSAVKFVVRWNNHQSMLNLNKHPNKYLQAAWNKYGPESFEFSAIEAVAEENLIEREQYWINLLKPFDREIGYNLRQEAHSNIGVKYGPQSKETIEKRTKTLTGIKHSEQARKNNSEAQKGKKLSEEHKRKVGRPGHIVTVETRAKISAKHSRPDKWPCPDKYNCNCRSCLDKKELARCRKRPKNIVFIKVENVDYKQAFAS